MVRHEERVESPAAPAAPRIVAPSLYVAADEPHMRSDMTRLRRIMPNMFFGQTVGSGHFCQLEVPNQVNAMIDRFLAIALTPSGTLEATSLRP
jgi:pimeloyl-ACP methyl ester carboxylesterase